MPAVITSASHTKKRLGRNLSFDYRDALFPMARAVPRKVAAPTAKTWSLPESLMRDQKDTPHCVGYSGYHWQVSTPIKFTRGPDGDESYRLAKLIDGNDEEGSDSRSLMKAYKNLGLVGSFVWAQKVDDAYRFVLTTGPALFGVMWRERMFDPKPDGTLDCSGAVVGGHEILILGVNMTKQYITIANSWGTTWGVRGRAKIQMADCGALFEEGGDICAAVEVSCKPYVKAAA